MTGEEVLKHTREAILEVFGKIIADTPEEAKALIEKSTKLGRDDRGEWAPGAPVIIYTEDGIPNGTFEPRVFERWFDVSGMIPCHFVEHVNAAVIAVWPG